MARNLSTTRVMNPQQPEQSAAGDKTSTDTGAMQGPTHKKALIKAEAERRRNEALGNMRWAAENASVRLVPAG